MWSGRRFVLVAAFAASATWGFVAACGGGYGSSSSTEDAASSDAGVPDAALAADPCVHVTPPPPPMTDDDPNTDLPTFNLAVASIGLFPDGGAPLGFDLDGVCTCDTRPTTAHGGAPSCVGARLCDADGGVDDTLPNLFNALSTLQDPQAFLNQPITAGRRTFLIQVSHYNGRANDRDVSVGIIMSDGIREPGCPGSDPNAVGIYPPGWCGDDHWSLSAASVLVGNGMIVPVVVGHGYVTDFHVVMEPAGRAVLPFGEEQTILALGSPVIAARVVPLGTDLQPRDGSKPPAPGEERYFALEDGIVGGRILATDLLATLGAQEVNGADSGFLCNSPVFDLLRPSVCGGVDLAATSSLDFSQANCDSLSAALSFRALPALAGAVHQLTPFDNPCLAGPNGEPVDASASYKCP